MEVIDVFLWEFMRLLMDGMSCVENFVSDGRVFVEMLRSAMCLVSDKAAYCTHISNFAIGSW